MKRAVQYSAHGAESEVGGKQLSCFFLKVCEIFVDLKSVEDTQMALDILWSIYKDSIAPKKE